MLKRWDELPEEMKNECVQKYHNILQDKKISLCVKRIFDLCLSIFLFIIFLPIFLIIGILIKLDSKGPIIYKQIRVTQYGRKFKIFKFRTMVIDADLIGTQVTVSNDCRITKIGLKLRKFRIDEIPQLINIILGDMSFVGARPEVVKYVEKYSIEMMATLLLPAGVTSQASIKYKDEERLLKNIENIDETYINEILPEKMKYNLECILNFSFFYELKIMFWTVSAVLKKEENAIKDLNEVEF